MNRRYCVAPHSDSLDKDADGLLSVNINMNYFTDSAALQQVKSASKSVRIQVESFRTTVELAEGAGRVCVVLRILYRSVDPMAN